MELSALLTKKAALIGGGTAATTTAVVVPVAVTQSNKKEEIKRKATTEPSNPDSKKEDEGGSEEEQGNKDLNPPTPAEPDIKPKPITPSLPPKNDSIIQAFNSPSECIKRSFPHVTVVDSSKPDHEKGYFSRPENLTVAIPTHNGFAGVDFSNPQPLLDKPNYGCLTFIKSKETDNKEFRLEIAVRNNDWGWIWMSGLQKKSGQNDDGYEFYYREAAVKWYQNKWALWIGVDGKFDNTDAEAPSFTSDIFSGIDAKEIQECDQSSANCKNKEFRTLLWIPNESTDKKFLPQDGNWEKSVLAFKSGDDLNYNKKETPKKRHGVFGDGRWHPTADKQTDTVSFKKSLAEKYKGEWKDLISYCEDTSNNKTTKSIYTILCL